MINSINQLTILFVTSPHLSRLPCKSYVIMKITSPDLWGSVNDVLTGVGRFELVRPLLPLGLPTTSPHLRRNGTSLQSNWPYCPSPALAHYNINASKTRGRNLLGLSIVEQASIKSIKFTNLFSYLCIYYLRLLIFHVLDRKSNVILRITSPDLWGSVNGLLTGVGRFELVRPLLPPGFPITSPHLATKLYQFTIELALRPLPRFGAL